jgi:Region found in RelA / SpoT proteins
MDAYDSPIECDECEGGFACNVMPYYEKLRFTLNQVDKAGRCLVEKGKTGDEIGEAFKTLFNWRAAHSLPLNHFYITLRGRAKKVDRGALTAQRMKRVESIFRKLSRQPTMQMSQMQDIGGCRAIVSGMKTLNELIRLYESSPLRHTVRPPRNYIAIPKDDGYRSVHLMYRFVGKATTIYWDKLRIEIQLRTKLQHSWATAVETVDTYTGEELKFGLGSDDWRRFFQLMGSAHARFEDSPSVPGTPQNEKELRDEIRHLELKLRITQMLHSWSFLTQHITGIKSGKDFWYLIEIKPQEGRADIEAFPLAKMREAESMYQKKEVELRRTGSNNKVVLVSVYSLTNLQKMYPNYFADTTYFIGSLVRFLNVKA